MPHRPRPGTGSYERRYIRKDGELIHARGKEHFFVIGEVVESPRHLSPSHQAWTLAQLRYDLLREMSAASRKKKAQLKAELRILTERSRSPATATPPR